MPGVDGEFIPMQDIIPVKYRFKPTSRYRGWCNEGSEYQSDMYDAIEFTPKVGMNLFMMEFFNPTVYYRRYYSHIHNERNRTPEPISDTQVLQWKRACETELSKRGLMFHDIGHGWTCQPFGIDTALDSTTADTNDATVTDEQRKRLPLIGGVRRISGGSPNHTQFCMSPPESRSIVANFVADYAQNHTNSDYIHVWLGDGRKNHCECEECQKKSPSDWYVMLLNEIDEALTARNLKTRIVYIAYTETIWAPETERLKNPKRFALLFAPSTRKYYEPLKINDYNPKISPYVRNKNDERKETDELFWHFRDWSREWNGANLSYEYHFWRHFYHDVGGISLSKIINEDIKFYGKNNIHGVIEDGSQRSFFPTGLAFYTYARTLFDSSVDFESVAEDYFYTAFGEDWRKFYNYLERLGEAFGHKFMAGEDNYGTGRSPWYKPEKLSDLQHVADILRDGRKLISEHYNSEYRLRTVSVRLLEFHARYAELLAETMMHKVVGNDEEAIRAFDKLMLECGARELEFERWYDHGLFCKYTVGKISGKSVTGIEQYEQM